MADIDWGAAGDFLKNRPAPSSGSNSDLSSRYPELYGGSSSGAAPADVPMPARAAGAATPSVPSPEALERLRAGRVDPEGPTAAEYDRMSWGEYAPIVANNILPSGWEAIKGVGTAIAHPIQTGKAIVNLGAGLGSKGIDAASTAMTGEPVFDPATKAEREAVADALIGSYKGRYGGGEEGEFWKHLAEDPMGYAADIASVATGGAGAVAKLGMIDKAGTVARVAGMAGNLDPVQAAMNATGRTLSVAGKAVPYSIMVANKFGTGLPFEVLQSARRIGLSGDAEAGAAFISALKNSPNFNADTAARFNKAIEEMEDQGRAQYLQNLRTSAMNNAEVDLTLPSMTRDEIEQMVDKAANRSVLSLDPPYSASDIDTAKKALAGIDEAMTHPNPAARTIAELDRLKRNIYTLSNQISDPVLRGRIQSLSGDLSFSMALTDPAYGQAMGVYQAMKDALNQTTKDFGSPKMSDAQRAKRLATMFRRRDAEEVFRRLEATPSGRNLRYSLAGQAASPWLSDTAHTLIGGIGGPLSLGYMVGSHPLAAAGVAAGLLNSSPRVAAATQYNLGRLERNVNAAASAAAKKYAPPVATNITSQLGSAMAPDYEEGRAGPQAYGGRVERKAGGRVGIDHERLADQLVGAAERAKKGISKGTEQLLDLPDDHIAHALELANRSI